MQDLEPSCAELFANLAPGESFYSRPSWMERCHQEDTILPMLAWYRYETKKKEERRVLCCIFYIASIKLIVFELSLTRCIEKLQLCFVL